MNTTHSSTQKMCPHAVAAGATGSKSHTRQCQVTSIFFVGATAVGTRDATFGLGVSAAVGTVSSVSDDGPEEARWTLFRMAHPTYHSHNLPVFNPTVQVYNSCSCSWPVIIRRKI